MARLEHLNKPSKDLVLDLINRANTETLAQPLTFDDVDFSNPRAITDGLDGRNAEIDVSLKGSNSELDVVPVSYWRIALPELFMNDNALLPSISTPTNVTELITALNNFHGLALTLDDVEDATFDNLELPMTITLKALPTSYAFTGEVDLTISRALDALIVNAELDGLKLPEQPQLTLGEISFTKENGDLLAGTGLKTPDMLSMTNEELEIFIGAHRRGAPDAYVSPTESNYSIELADDRLWSFTFGVGLLDETRGSNVTDLYNVRLNISDGTDDFELFLETTDGKLVWSVAELENPVITDNAPADSLLVAQNSQQLAWYAQAFPNATTNAEGALLGEFTFTLTATPIRAVWVPPLEIVSTATITPAA